MNHKQVIAYKPIYFQLTGSIEAALMLSQAEYLSTRHKGKSFSKTSEEWESDTGLTYWKQQSARKILSKFSFWKEKLSGTPAKLFFKVDVDELHSYIDSLYGIKQQELRRKIEPKEPNLEAKVLDLNEDNGNSDIEISSNCDNLKLDRGNSKSLFEEKPRTIIGSIVENIEKNNSNIITEIGNFGETPKISHKKLSKDVDLMKSKAEEIDFYKTKIRSTRLMENFSPSSPWFAKEFEKYQKFLEISLAVRLNQGKINFEVLEEQIKNSCSIGDLLQKLVNTKYSTQDTLKDLIYIYSDGLVSAWSRENKAIKSLMDGMSSELLTFNEIEDCLVWIKNTLNYSVSLSSIIPGLPWFRKYRRHLFDNRYACEYTFRSVTGQNSAQKSSSTVEITNEDMNNFFASQKRKRV